VWLTGEDRHRCGGHEKTGTVAGKCGGQEETGTVGRCCGLEKTGTVGKCGGQEVTSIFDRWDHQLGTVITYGGQKVAGTRSRCGPGHELF
jgi:hypothetical protein